MARFLRAKQCGATRPKASERKIFLWGSPPKASGRHTGGEDWVTKGASHRGRRMSTNFLHILYVPDPTPRGRDIRQNSQDISGSLSLNLKPKENKPSREGTSFSTATDSTNPSRGRLPNPAVSRSEKLVFVLLCLPDLRGLRRSSRRPSWREILLLRKPVAPHRFAPQTSPNGAIF